MSKYYSFDFLSFNTSATAPRDPKEGQIWIAQDINSEYKINSDYSSIGINYAMEYYNGEWTLRKTYVYTEKGWELLYYVPVSNGEVDLSSSDINGNVKWEYGYTGEYKIFTAPYSGYYKVELWGAGGGNISGVTGGRGAYTVGKIFLKSGTNLYIYVGGAGNTSGVGGWNGGNTTTNRNSYYGGGGGGSTDIRLVPTTEKNVWNEFESLKSRIMVAAGGGGSYNYNNGTYYGNGGAGGELVGLNGSTNDSSWPSGMGGSQTLGGISTTYATNTRGGFGYGGALNKTGEFGCGGGGYYGGGDANHVSGGGGGSSYISGHTGCNSISELSSASVIYHTGEAYHYSGAYFKETNMIAGNKTQPTFDGSSTMVGNSGNGYAKITLFTIEENENIISNDAKDGFYDRKYTYSGTYQLFEVEKTGEYKIELWGARGGTPPSVSGGYGAYTSGIITLNKGEKFYVYVGGSGTNINNVSLGSWNGGGKPSINSTYSSGGGGGATDIRTVATTSNSIWGELESLKTRIMVAAGGGGGYNYNSATYYGNGGAGGGLIGYNGSTNSSSWPAGTGGTQVQGAQYGPSTFGHGAVSSSNAQCGAGGGGWYGGGAASHVSGGAGGSSYISGHAGCIAVTSSGNPKVQTYSTLTDSISYTGYKFTNTLMIDGNGYEWKMVKSSITYMPTFDGSSTMTGNTENGYAKITFLG